MVMDATGETIGVVTGYNMQGGYMDAGAGMLFAEETRIPLDAIGDTGASGLYLTGTKDEVARQYGGGVASGLGHMTLDILGKATFRKRVSPPIKRCDLPGLCP